MTQDEARRSVESGETEQFDRGSNEPLARFDTSRIITLWHL